MMEGITKVKQSQRMGGCTNGSNPRHGGNLNTISYWCSTSTVVTQVLYLYLRSTVLEDLERYTREHLNGVHRYIHTAYSSLHVYSFPSLQQSGIVLGCVDLSWDVLSLTRAVLRCWYRFDTILQLAV